MRQRYLFVLVVIITSFVTHSCIEETPFDKTVGGRWKCREVDAYDSIMRRYVCFDCVIDIEQGGNYLMTVKGVVVDSLFEKKDIGDSSVKRQIVFHQESGSWSLVTSAYDIILQPNSCKKLNYDTKQMEYVDCKKHRHHVREGYDMDYLQIRDSCFYYPDRDEQLLFELNKNTYQHETDSIIS